MRRSLLALLLAPSIVFAQAATPTAAQVFGDGHPVQYKNTELDHRFGRSQIALALEKGTDDPSCAPLITGMLAMLADAAPTLHKRDENFTVSPPLVRALQTQLTVPGFPANVFLAAMVRRVYLERKLPAGWLDTAKKLDPTGMQIDLAKLRFLDEGVHPIDSMYFTFPYLLDRYDELLALSLSDTERLRRVTAAAGRVILAIDGLQPDVGHEVLWVLRDVLSGEVLLARSLLSSCQDDLAKLIDEVKQAL